MFFEIISEKSFANSSSPAFSEFTLNLNFRPFVSRNVLAAVSSSFPYSWYIPSISPFTHSSSILNRYTSCAVNILFNCNPPASTTPPYIFPSTGRSSNTEKSSAQCNSPLISTTSAPFSSRIIFRITLCQK